MYTVGFSPSVGLSFSVLLSCFNLRCWLLIDRLIVGPAMSYSESPTVLQYPPPTLGQHTVEVLRQQLNYDDSQISKLQQSKVIQLK